MILGCESGDGLSREAPVADGKQSLPAAVAEEQQPPPVKVAAEDPRMAAAIADARANMEGFLAALANPLPSQRSFSVKVAIKDGDRTEHLWLAPIRLENGQFVGRVNNEPTIVKTVKFGEEISVAKGDISDWIYIDDQKMVGGYTARALMSAADEPTASVGDHELVGNWSLVSTERDADPQLKQGFKLIITKTELTMVAPNGAKKVMGQLHRVDPTTTPHQIDLRNGDLVGLGIYELDGDSLKFIIRDPGLGRPTEMKGSPEAMLFTLERM
jgi:uncharacterized protein (TIGR03067 family)